MIWNLLLTFLGQFHGSKRVGLRLSTLKQHQRREQDQFVLSTANMWWQKYNHMLGLQFKRYFLTRFFNTFPIVFATSTSSIFIRPCLHFFLHSANSASGTMNFKVDKWVSESMKFLKGASSWAEFPDCNFLSTFNNW